MTADPQNPLVLDILTASETAYIHKPDDKISEVIFILLNFALKRGISIHYPPACQN